MTAGPATTVSVHTLDVPGATLHYEIRGAGPLIVFVGAPMGADAFAPIADILASTHTVLTTDPRGHQRSPLDDPEQDSTAALRGADLAALITHLGAGPAVVFGSSGGAVSALALVQQDPDLVTTVIAHEPPSIGLLDDRDSLLDGTADLIETYRGGDTVGAWRKFFAQANIQIPDPLLTQMFGGDRPAQDLASEKYWFEHEIVHTVGWQPDPAVLAAAPTRVIIGLGADSAGQLCARTCHELARRLGTTPTVFPGGHTGFTEDIPAFAARLREVLRTA
ncbi:alpha/beta fold hydrolase [Nocardia aurea]|uniref:alpha/beta fold hydrolase n=1 Tax=Nocardia aurea TaxID=2144174 RepID=UPI0033BE74DA